MMASPAQLLLAPPIKAPSMRSGASTPQPPPRSAPGTQLPRSNAKALGSRLRHLVDNPSRTATFAVNVTIHELSNIPQLNGKFACRWKFRGQKPNNGDRLLEFPERRTPLPATRSVAPQTLRHSSSMMSLRTPQPGGSGTSTPSLQSANAMQRSLNVLAPNVPAPSFPHRPHSQHTLPTSVVSRSAKASTACSSGNGGPAHAKESSTGSGMTGTTSSSSVTLEEATDQDSIVGDGASLPPSSAQSTYSLNSAITKPGGLPVPGTGLGPGVPTRPRSASRSGTAPASFTSDDSPSTFPSRAASVYSMTSIGPAASFDSGVASEAHSPDSTERRGTTPIEKIHAHTVQWEYEVQYVIRIPLGKPVPVDDKSKARASSPTRRSRTLPILGEGAMSHSGLKLEIEELPDGNDQHARPFGYVNLDLAPFAELGTTSRKFLLKDSKTNATIRISIDMRFIGGQQHWVTPPLTEGHFVNDISQLTGDDGGLYKELQLIPTASRSSDSATSSSVSARPSNRSSKSEVSLTRQPTNMSATVVSQQSKNRYKSYEHHLRPEARVSRTRRQDSIVGDLSPRRYPTSSTSGQSLGTFGTFGTESMSSWTADTSSTPPRAVIPTQPLQMSPASSLIAERASGGFFDMPPPTRTLTLDSPTFLKGINTTDEPLSPNEVSLTSPVLPPLSPDQSPPSLGLTRHVRHRSSHRHFLRDHRGHADDLQPDLVIEHVFNPRAADEIGPFTYVPNEEDEDALFGGELDELALDAEPEMPAPHHRRWSRIRRRVISSTHRGRTGLESGGVSSAVY